MLQYQAGKNNYFFSSPCREEVKAALLCWDIAQLCTPCIPWPRQVDHTGVNTSLQNKCKPLTIICNFTVNIVLYRRRWVNIFHIYHALSRCRMSHCYKVVASPTLPGGYSIIYRLVMIHALHEPYYYTILILHKIHSTWNIHEICDTMQANAAQSQTLRRLTLRRVKLHAG